MSMKVMWPWKMVGRFVDEEEVVVPVSEEQSPNLSNHQQIWRDYEC